MAMLSHRHPAALVLRQNQARRTQGRIHAITGLWMRSHRYGWMRQVSLSPWLLKNTPPGPGSCPGGLLSFRSQWRVASDISTGSGRSHFPQKDSLPKWLAPRRIRV
jgi:hypothetical protein